MWTGSVPSMVKPPVPEVDLRRSRPLLHRRRDSPRQTPERWPDCLGRPSSAHPPSGAQALRLDPALDRPRSPERPLADPQVGGREPAGGALALEGAARDAEVPGDVVEAEELLDGDGVRGCR